MLSLLSLAVRLKAQPHYPPRITSWIHRNDWQKAVASVQANNDAMIEVSPMWYESREDGLVYPIDRANALDAELLDVVANRPIVFRPIITNVNNAGTQPDLAMSLLTDPGLKERNLLSILTVARHPLFNGIDLDYEGIRGTNLVHLANFVDELAALLHAEGKSLSVCIEVQRDAAVLDSWYRIGVAADLVRYMVYSEHTERTEPGPIASLEWSLSYLKRVVSVIPTEKLSYGIAIYGRLWGERNYSATWEALTKYAGDTPIERDEINNTPFFKKGNEVAWFEDAESIRAKILLGRTLGIDAFSFWRLGGEDPAIWDMIRHV